jgi:hypothetical protein
MEPKNRSSNLPLSKKILLSLTTTGLVGGAYLLFVLHFISIDVRTICSDATRQFGGDCVEALSSLATSDTHPFEERNDAIWALGEIGDPRAGPTLQGLLYDTPLESSCDARSGICNYGVEKAISLCSGANVVRWVWRWM